jgi:hypothetical protein
LYAQGCTLCHRTASPPQRPLGPEDYTKLGSLFLFDLIIRNTDRFPSRKAFPRPGNCSIEDSGNPGNMMFGPEPGMVYSIDKEMVISVDSNILDSYVEAVASIVKEILFNRGDDSNVQSLVEMWSEPWPFLRGQVNLSLEDSREWSKNKGQIQALRHSQLNMIRLRIEHCRTVAAAARKMAVAGSEGPSSLTGLQTPTKSPAQHANGEEGEDEEHDDDNDNDGVASAPMSDDETQWREWARASLPTAIADITTFIHVHTGYATPAFAAQSFREGFILGMLKACNFYRDVTGDPSTILSRYPKLGIAMMKEPESVHLPFVRSMCNMLQEILKKAVTNCPHVFPPSLKENVHMFKAVCLSSPRKASAATSKLKGLVRRSIHHSRSMPAGDRTVNMDSPIDSPVASPVASPVPK